MKYFVPGFSVSKGLKKYAKLSSGTYVLECTDCNVGEPKNLAPVDVWNFKFKILEGAPDAEGKSSVNRNVFHSLNILRPEHPKYKAEWDDPKSGATQFGVDELKSIALAMGVTANKKGEIEDEAFVGLKVKARLYYELARDGSGREFARLTDWESVD